MCIYIYIYIYILQWYMYIYIYIYMEGAGRPGAELSGARLALELGGALNNKD